jgi:hypothetical protein
VVNDKKCFAQTNRFDLTMNNISKKAAASSPHPASFDASLAKNVPGSSQNVWQLYIIHRTHIPLFPIDGQGLGWTLHWQ